VRQHVAPSLWRQAKIEVGGVTVVIRSPLFLMEAVGALTRAEVDSIAKAYGVRVGQGQPHSMVRRAVASCLQDTYHKAVGTEMTEMTKKAHEKRLQDTAANADQAAAAANAGKPPKEKKPRELKTFRFVEPESEEKRALLSKKKGQAKIAVDVLRDPRNADRTWDSHQLAAEMRAHPELKATLKGGKTDMSEKEALKMANYYIFDLRGNGHCIKMV
jgi:hypothetical protein